MKPDGIFPARSLLARVVAPLLLSVCITAGVPSSASAFEFIIRGGVSEMYDDNIAQTETDRIDDFITNLRLGLEFRHEGARHSISLTGNAVQQLYLENSNFNRNSQDLALDYRGDLTRFDRVHAINTYTHSFEPVNFDQAFTTDQGRYERHRNIFDFNYSRDMGSRITVNGRYNNEIIKTDNPLLDDLYIHRPGVQIDYSLGTANVISVFYSYIHINTEEHESAHVHRTGLGHRYYFTRQLYIENRGGQDYILTLDDLKYTRPFIQSALVGNIDEGFIVRFNFEKHTIMSEHNREIFDTWRISGNLEKQILRSVWMTLLGFYGKGEYVPSGTRNSFIGITTALIYRHRENTEGTVRYTMARANSSQAGTGYERNIWEAGISIRF